MKEDTTSLTFNSSELALGDLIVSSPFLQKPEVHPASKLTIDKTQERATIALASTLPAGSKAQLKVSFEGELTGSMMGYYRAAWEHEGKTKHYSLTQFEVCSSTLYPSCPSYSFPLAHCRSQGLPLLG